MKIHWSRFTKGANTRLMSKSQSGRLLFWKNFRQTNFSGKIVLVLSTWFGTGLLPIAPGTFGTLATVPLILVLDNIGTIYKALSLMIAIVVAIWASGRHQELLRQSDPREIVIDEVAGFLLTMLFLPRSWLAIGLGFIFFRLFDILKPYPIRQTERIKGGLGVVIDDLVAGLYAYAVVRIILLIPGFSGSTFTVPG